MRTLWLAAGISLAALGATGASADSRGYDRSGGWGYQRAIERTQRQCAQSLRWADSRREYHRISRRCDERLRELQREYRQALRHDRRRGDWDDDNRWRGRDRDDDDDDHRWRGRDRDDDD